VEHRYLDRPICCCLSGSSRSYWRAPRDVCASWRGIPHTQTRIVSQVQALARAHAGQTIVCVSHGTAIDLLARHILGLDVMRPAAFHIANTSVNIFVQDGVWQVVTLNKLCHLESLSP